MTAHIGIVGCSAEGAALCYRTICAEAEAVMGRHAHPEITMHTPSLAGYVAKLEDGDLEGVAALMLGSARKLQAAGATFLICPDNTIHQALPLVRPRSPLPWMSIAEVVADEAARRDLHHVGVMGTRWLVESEVYPAALDERGIVTIRPSADDIARVDAIIMDELVRGIFEQASIIALREVIARLAAAGAEAVVLGCTELPLVLAEAEVGLPLLDSTRLLARAALGRAI